MYITIIVNTAKEPMKIKPNIPQESNIYEGGDNFSKTVWSIGKRGIIMRRKNKYNKTKKLSTSCIKPILLSERNMLLEITNISCNFSRQN